MNARCRRYLGYVIFVVLLSVFKPGFADFTTNPEISFIPIPEDSIQTDHAAPVTSGASDIRVSPLSYDYGEIPVGSSSTKMFLVSNRGNETLIIYSATGMGSDPDQFAVVSSSMLTPPYSLSPGVTIGVRIRFSPTSAGPKSAIVRIESNDPDENPLDVNLSGTGLGPDIAIDPPSRMFGHVLLGSISSQVFVLSNEGTLDLHVSSVILAGTDYTHFTIDDGAGSFTLAAGSTRNINVSFRPLSLGAKNAVLRIASNDPDGNALDAALSGTGVAPDIAVSPISANFGNVTRGKNSSRTLVVNNTGNTDLHVSSTSIIGSQANQFSIISGGGPFTLPPGSIHNIVSSFNPFSLGPQSATLKIASNDPDENPINISLSGTAVEQDIAISPEIKDFGKVLTGSRVSQTFVISNAGTAALTVDSIELLDDHKNQFGIDNEQTAFTLAPDETLLVHVSFRPTDLGSLTAILQVTSNDPDENPFQITITGTGVEPNLSVFPISHDFGETRVDSSSLHTLMLENQGTADLMISMLSLTGEHSDQFYLAHSTDSMLISPGDTTTILAGFRPDSIGLKTAILQIISNDPDENCYRIDLEGTGVSPDLAIFPQAKYFGSVHVDSCLWHTFELGNTGTSELTIDSIEIIGTDSDQFYMDSISGITTLNPGESMNIDVAFCPTNPGEKSAGIRIHSNVPALDSVDATLHGLGIEPMLEISASSIDFGYMLVDSSAMQTVFVSNTGSAELIINPFTLTGADSAQFSIELQDGSVALAPGDTLTIEIYFKPTYCGEMNARVQIASNARQNPVDVTLMGTGAAPDISVSYRDLNFGSVLSKTCKDTGMVISNTGNWNLDVSRLMLRGSDTMHFHLTLPSLPLIIHPDDSIQITISFTPSIQGMKTCTLDIFSNDIDEPTLELTLQGFANENLAPQLVYSYPLDATQAAPANTPIQFKIIDQELGLNPHSLQVFVAGFMVIKNGLDQTQGKVMIDAHTNRLDVFYSPGSPFATDSVTVRIECSDMAMPPNTMQSLFAFKTDSFSIGTPQIKVMGPEGGHIRGTQSEVQMTVPDQAVTDTTTLYTSTIPEDILLPDNARKIGPAFYVGPTGLQFSDSVIIGLPFTPKQLSDHGLKDAMNLEVIHFSTLFGSWQKHYPLCADSNAVYLKTKESGLFIMATQPERIMAPIQLTGPEMVIVSRLCEYRVNRVLTTYGHPLEYRFFWGDKSVSSWSTDTLATHSWTEPGIYKIRAQGRCPSDTGLTIESDEKEIRVDYKTVVTKEYSETSLPTRFHLQQNYPNPFNPSTTFEFQVPVSSHVRLVIYDILGQHVETLVDKELGAGFYKMTWADTKQTGRKICSGVYLCTLSASDYTKTVKMLLLK